MDLLMSSVRVKIFPLATAFSFLEIISSGKTGIIVGVFVPSAPEDEKALSDFPVTWIE